MATKAKKTAVAHAGIRPKKTFSKYREALAPIPHLVENQLASYKQFLEKDLFETIKSYFPMKDYSEKKFELDIKSLHVNAPEHDEQYAKDNKTTYEAELKARVVLKNKVLGTEKEQEMFLSEIPMMTANGTFIVNGAERVVVAQLARSPGVAFSDRQTRKGRFFGAKIIPSKGAWIELESESDNVMYVRIDKKRKFAVSSLLRALGVADDTAMVKLFKNEIAIQYINASIAKDPAKKTDESYVEIYRKLRDGEIASADNAKEFVDSILSPERYDLSRVGRHLFNQRFNKSMDAKALAIMTLTIDDIVTIIEKIAELNANPKSKADDIDHLASRRVKFVGELLMREVSVGMLRIRRNVQDKMSTIDTETTLPIQMLNQRPLQSLINGFFSTNQLSQFENQHNPLAEIEHSRILSALGPGGLTRERAGFEVRDVHPSHYGRLCPIHTPEGPNIGLILHMSIYARVNDFGMLETPYAKVVKGKITDEIVYLNAAQEEQYTIAHAGLSHDADGKILDDMVEARVKTNPGMVKKTDVDFVDVAPSQAFSVAAALIPFLENTDAKRTLMACSMQKQSMPCIVTQAPLVATGMEERAALDSGRMIVATDDGVVSYADAQKIETKNTAGKTKTYALANFMRTNQGTIYHNRPIVRVGDKVKKGMVLADAAATQNGELALGQNVLVAFMCWNGANFEDAIILSEKLVKNSIFSSIHIDTYECVVRDTKLGEEQTTHDIPNVGEARLKDLDEDGIVRIGAEVREGDILVGKITPKGETELTPEERLLRSIFGEKARDVKDASMRMDHGRKGRVIGVKIHSRDAGHELESGVIKKIYVEIAQLRNIQVGDKLAGRYGNKGVISTILPEEDMPYMADGTSVDVVLTSLGVSSRMNLGQILELHLGLAANSLHYQAVVPPFSGAAPEEIKKELEEAGFSTTGKMKLYDGRTGEAFDQDVAVGYMYILKLEHMVEDKMHARSIGPYSLITQQPLGGKSQSGGQRFGEMEVWALEGYGASHMLREMLTVKSDDIVGRTAAFNALIKGTNLQEPNMPASFQVMLNYLRGLALDVKLEGSKNNFDKAYEQADIV